MSNILIKWLYHEYKGNTPSVKTFDHKIWPALVGMLFVLLLSTTGTSATPPSQQEAERKLASVQAQIQKVQRKLDEDRGEYGKMERELRETERLIGQIDRRLDDAETGLQNSRQRIQELKTQQQQLLQQLSRHRGILRTQARAEYLYSGQEKLKLLLNQQDPVMISRMLVYYDYLHRARTREMEEARKVLRSINQVQDEILEQQDLTIQSQNKLLHEKQQLQQQQRKKESVLAKLSASVSAEQVKLTYLEKDEQQLRELIRNLQKALVGIADIDQKKEFRESKGKLFWPVVGKPNNRFGQRRSEAYSKLNWQGVFIPSNAGNNVRSIFHGRVVFAEWMRGFGLLIIIDHGDNYMSLYGHNQSLYKKPGEWVDAGERIAKVGNSGGNTRTGLYFEIRKQGEPINPGIWCVKPVPVSRLD